MANVVAFPQFYQAREEARKTRAQAISNIGLSVSQALMTYSQMKHQDDLERLNLLDKVIQRYGSQADQATLTAFDDLAGKKFGVRLPRDPNSGKLLPPPPSDKFQLVRDELAKNKDPQFHNAWLTKELTGKSPWEQQIVEQGLAIKRAAQESLEVYRNQRVQIDQMNAESARIRAGKGDEFSGQYLLPTGQMLSAPQYTQQFGPEGAPGARPLTNREASIDLNKRRTQLMQDNAELNKKIKMQQYERIKNEIAHDIFSGMGKQFIHMVDLEAHGKTIPKELKPGYEAAKAAFLKQHPLPGDPDFGWSGTAAAHGAAALWQGVLALTASHPEWVSAAGEGAIDPGAGTGVGEEVIPGVKRVE